MKVLVSLCNKRPEVDKAPGVWLVECDTEAMKATLAEDPKKIECAGSVLSQGSFAPNSTTHSG